MTDSMNIPELERLDYHSPLCKCPECKRNPKPEQPDYSKCRHCGACRVVRPAGEWQFACKCNEDDKIYPPEQPNQQIMLIKTIQGLTTAILNDISKLPESVLKDQAYDDMNIFETGILFRLQKEYE